jgi:2,3-bisphosphoglycerate-dependent phosphoglycerate mutase
MATLVLVRHGQSQWNLENRFTGWTDVDLSTQGLAEAHRAGQLMQEQGITVDSAFTSLLKRAIKTLDIVLEEMDLMWIDVTKSWKLNERHYGALQGLNKAETAEKYGDEQVAQWRRSYSILPPLLEDGDSRLPANDIKYRNVNPSLLPRGESLEMTVKRVLPFWETHILPVLAAGHNPMVIAHGNSLRALVKFLDKVSNADIVGVEIPTGIPLIYEFDESLRPVSHHYLGQNSHFGATKK